MTMRRAVVSTVLMLLPALANAQERGWVAEVSIGYAGFVDDATKNYFLAGGGVRRHITPRLSIGPEVVIMSNSGSTRDRNVLLTGNVVFDTLARSDTRRVTPFLVGGVGIFWGRDQVRGGPYWSSDPAFTAGGGVRARVSESLSAAAEYRIGWELHQRLSATAGFHW
jgi:opacity protein-like surface antigen